MKTIQRIISHPWDLNEADAIELQRKLSRRVIRSDNLGDVRYVAGVDVAYDDNSRQQFAAAAVLDADSLALMEKSTAQATVSFPYISGLFSFRELPPIIKALEKLDKTPDLIICDGQGIAHPRRFGLACHLGVLFDIPTIGCSKTRLLGNAEALGSKRGSQVPLIDNGETVGCVLRTQDDIKPIFVSAGHLVSLPKACHWILKLTPAYRLPETTRQADRIVRRLKREFLAGTGR